MFRVILALMLCGLALVAQAEPRRYTLVPDKSVVEFTYLLNGRPEHGTMPMAWAEIGIDFAEVPQSFARVGLDVRGATADAMLAAAALKSREVLNAAEFPEIRFESQTVTGALREGVEIDGQVTLRGVTRPMRLTGGVYRPRGSAEDDLSRLIVILTGTLDRSAFGATGFSGVVADRVELRITAHLRATEH